MNSYCIFPGIGQFYLYDNSPSQSLVVWKIPLQNMFNFVFEYKATCSFSVDDLGKDSLQIRTFTSNFRFSRCIFKVSHFYWLINALNCIKLKG